MGISPMTVSGERVYLQKRHLYDGLNRFLREGLSTPSTFRIEGLKWRGEGAFYTVFSFWLEEAGRFNGDYVLRVLNPFDKDPEAADRLTRSCELLRLLDGAGGLAPRCLGYDPEGKYLDLPFTVETFVPGLPLSEAPKDPKRRIPVAAREVVRIHSLSVSAEARALFPPGEDFPIEMLRRAESHVNRLDQAPGPVTEALDAARRLLPQRADVVLLHGDAQLQNLVEHLVLGESRMEYAWIDWEFARPGDRAYDLAIFTRGQLKSLRGLKGGRDDYLEAYRRESGIAVPDDRVLFHEILLTLGTACAEIEYGVAGPIEQSLQKLVALTRYAASMRA